jgi:hypothetical protein
MLVLQIEFQLGIPYKDIIYHILEFLNSQGTRIVFVCSFKYGCNILLKQNGIASYSNLVQNFTNLYNYIKTKNLKQTWNRWGNKKVNELIVKTKKKADKGIQFVHERWFKYFNFSLKMRNIKNIGTPPLFSNKTPVFNN